MIELIELSVSRMPGTARALIALPTKQHRVPTRACAGIDLRRARKRPRPRLLLPSHRVGLPLKIFRLNSLLLLLTPTTALLPLLPPMLRCRRNLISQSSNPISRNCCSRAALAATAAASSAPCAPAPCCRPHDEDCRDARVSMGAPPTTTSQKTNAGAGAGAA